MSDQTEDDYGTRAEKLLNALADQPKASPAVLAATAQAYATLALVEAVNLQTACVEEVGTRIAILGDDLERVLRAKR